MGLAVGTAPAVDVRLGDTAVAAVYLGDEKVWPTGANWESLFYDYWDLADATTEGWPSRRGLLPTIPVDRLDADGVAVLKTTLTGLPEVLGGMATINRVTKPNSGGYGSWTVGWDYSGGVLAAAMDGPYQAPGDTVNGHALVMKWGTQNVVPVSDATRIVPGESGLQAFSRHGTEVRLWLEPNTSPASDWTQVASPGSKTLSVEVPMLYGGTNQSDAARLRFIGLLPEGPHPYDTPEWEAFVAWAVETHGVTVRSVADGALSDAILALNPVGYWKLDEAAGTTAVDSSGNGRDGTYNGAYTLQGLNGCVTFAAPFGYVEIPEDDAFWPGTANGLTLFALCHASPAIGGTAFVAAKGLPGLGFEWDLKREGGWRAAARSVAVGTALSEETWGGVVTPGVWHAVATDFPSTGNTSFHIWMDSAEPLPSVSVGSPYPPENSTTPLRIGYREYGPWIGGIAHVAIFPGQLSSAQVQTLMDAARGEGWIT